ncbi:MAG: FliA/WhiG family polymerase sigma factor [Solirubrobacterales bacterium]|jgi:RNA polymerase sigma factor for flagellar operon FliA|nr:FliA/WhiG family polymerase sigma factor [Solirubrobacterales bacterium]
MIPTTRRLSHTEVLSLWEEHNNGSATARDRLVLTFAPLVKYVVYKKLREMPARCEVEDFISCGLEALIQSIDRYDPSKGATLEQYAWTRIHGAVLDELRRQDWAPRSVRRWERDIERADEAFTALHGRRPHAEELADALAIDVAELRRHRSEIQRSDVTSLNALVAGDDDTTIERLDALASADVTLDPEHQTACAEAKGKFRAAFARLPRREREVAVLLYVKHLTLAEIGVILGVSESRVCQIHGGLKKQLRLALDAETGLFQAVA